ncbi:MAG: rbsB, partial [candidate division NC10 bacterium]|nr:rbsB [candidate division NC10 bacterium]
MQTVLSLTPFSRIWRTVPVALLFMTCFAGPSSSQVPRWTIGMSQCNLGEPWRVQMNADVKQAASTHPDIRMVFKDAQNDALRQGAH